MEVNGEKDEDKKDVEGLQQQTELLRLLSVARTALEMLSDSSTARISRKASVPLMNL